MDDKVIGVNDFEYVCRICLGKKENMISMFESSLLPNLINTIKTYREMLEECASVHISADDLLPKNICLECLKYLEQSYKFKIQYLSTEKLLEEIIASTQPNIKVEVSIEEDGDFKDEDVSFNFHNSRESSPNEVIKKELISIKEELNKNINKELNDSSTVQNYKCTECEKVFKLKVEFYKHYKLSHSKIVKCMYCDKTFEMIKNVKRHSPEMVRCKICKKDCGCKTSLRVHILGHTTCNVCGKTCKSVQACNLHIKRTHDKRYLCTYCGKAFAISTNYIIHVRTHTGERPYHCTQCDARFKCISGLQRHYTAHSNERKFECDVCKNKFKSKDQLEYHRRIQHLDSKKHSCDICNKEFKRKDYLREHEKIHTGELNHICQYCNKAFIKSYKLRMHLRTHTGEKPFTCTKCGKKFNQKFILNSHMKTHSEVLE